METHLTLSIVNTKLRDGVSLDDIAFELETSTENLSEHLAKEGYVYDMEANQFKR